MQLFVESKVRQTVPYRRTELSSFSPRGETFLLLARGEEIACGRWIAWVRKSPASDGSCGRESLVGDRSRSREQRQSPSSPFSSPSPSLSLAFFLPRLILPEIGHRRSKSIVTARQRSATVEIDCYRLISGGNEAETTPIASTTGMSGTCRYCKPWLKTRNAIPIEEGTFEELCSSGILFKKLMENAGKMEEHEEEKQGESAEENVKSSENGEVTKMVNALSKKEEKPNKGKEGKTVLIKQEERETGVVSLKVLAR
ncbi:hypothetical protein B296_00037628 [Ensete ventricosum]|uniref:Uncharacterized protein n=1 Tax=Ensete ventricosum TaxID=4639 RepID=A0A426ZZ06_ENSVE|nr:hypothetical protein B296_00037628 [Ensete ventricosum]